MIYFEFRLEGPVIVYELADPLMILRAEIEAEARVLPAPETIEAAQDYTARGCFHFEMFESVSLAASWVNHYEGFRANEVRAEWVRYMRRRVGLALADAA